MSQACSPVSLPVYAQTSAEYIISVGCDSQDLCDEQGQAFTIEKATARVALGYADRGWGVFPVRRDKTPYTEHGYKSATTDAAQIQSWWNRYPSANIGVACDASQLLVLDIDPRNGGDRTLAQLQSEYGELPHGPRSRTGGGGSHYFYIAPAFRPVGKLGNGVDVKYHGYVVLPPSLHESGRRYEWLVAPDETELPALPAAWRSRLLTGSTNSTAASNARSLVYRDGGAILEGSRDTTLTQIAGAMRRASVSPEGIEAALRIENAQRCRPPLSDADVHRIASSVGKYPIGPPWMLDPVTFAGGSDLTHTEWAVLIVLCRGADQDGYVFGGNWIGEKAHLSYPTTYRALRGLQTKGRILLVERACCKDEHGRWRANGYQLVEHPSPFIREIDNLPVKVPLLPTKDSLLPTWMQKER
jgi:Bifunctional DNA primase/polymerase, N-terminal/Primase C terminal 1 (PriCT-1)